MVAPGILDGLPADLARDVRRRAADDLDLALHDLEQWVAVDTPSDDIPALDALARMIAERIEAYGASIDLVDGDTGLYVHATLAGSGRARIALLGHHDTVFPAGTAARRPFTLQDDLARGPRARGALRCRGRTERPCCRCRFAGGNQGDQLVASLQFAVRYPRLRSARVRCRRR